MIGQFFDTMTVASNDKSKWWKLFWATKPNKDNKVNKGNKDMYNL